MSYETYDGVRFDPATGKTAYPDILTGEYKDTGYTFERASWTGPRQWAPIIGIMNFWGQNVSGRLSPLNYATRETAEKVLRWVKAIAPRKYGYRIDEVNRTVGPFSTTVARSILATAPDGREEFFNAGRLAVGLFRSPMFAAGSFRAEVVTAFEGDR